MNDADAQATEKHHEQRIETAKQLYQQHGGDMRRRDMASSATVDQQNTVQSDRAHVLNAAKYKKRGIKVSVSVIVVSSLAAIFVRSKIWLVVVLTLVAAGLAEFVRSQVDLLTADAEKAVAMAADPERQRKLNVLKGARESAEWLNSIVGKLWPLVNTDLLIPLLDLVEDALLTRVPSIVTAVRIDDLDFGTNPLRVISLRQLDDDLHIADNIPKDADNSRFFNMESEFAYVGSEGKNASITNTHFIVYIGLGVPGVTTVEIPLFVELLTASGCAKIRAEAISDPPFIRDTWVTFPEVPVFSIAVRPLKALNVMRLPVLSSYVHHAVADVISQFLAPKAYHLDVARLIMGHDVDLDTESRGVVVIVIHSARCLYDTDAFSKSDPYVAVTFSKLGKTLYTTRVIRNELNPAWEETAFVPIRPDALRDGEDIKLEIWDSDKFTADDSLGNVTISLGELYDNAGELQHYDREVCDAIRKTRATGRIKFSAGYFASHKLQEGSTKAPPGTLLQMRVGGAEGLVAAVAGNASEKPSYHKERVEAMMDAKLPPKASQPSGILSIQLHQMADLDLNRFRKSTNTDASGFHHHIPSTYCQIFVNDELIFTSRVKRLSNVPYINARCEVFCPDWTATRIDFAVLDKRDGEADAMVGIVSFRLADVLSNCSQITAWRPLMGGIGTGRCRISLLFKPVLLSLPETMRSWNIGTALIDQITLKHDVTDFNGDLIIRLSSTRYKVSPEHEASIKQDGQFTWKCQPPLSVPILRRHRQTLRFQLCRRSSTLMRREVLLEGPLWLSNVPDDQQSSRRVILFSPDVAKRHAYNNEVGLPELPAGERLGTTSKQDNNKDSGQSVNNHAPILEVSLRIIRGLSILHQQVVRDMADQALYDGLRMRDHAIQAGERQKRSARFVAPDKHQRWTRTDRLAKAQEAEAELSGVEDDSDDDRNAVQLGTVHTASGGGLTEGQPGKAANSATVVEHETDPGDDEFWEDHSTAQEEHHRETKPAGRLRRTKDQIRSDRMHERGAFQVKITRTAKWLKDSSARKLRSAKQTFHHKQTAPVIPDTEGISHL